MTMIHGWLVYLLCAATKSCDTSPTTGHYYDMCFIQNQMCKWNPTCFQSHGDIILRPFLITGSGSSGTTWFRHSMVRKGFDVADESFGVEINKEVSTGPQPMSSKVVNRSAGVDGMVAWTARCLTDDIQRKALHESDEGHGHVLFPIGYQFRFRYVIHLVRHPLKAINSDLFFSSHIRNCSQRMSEPSNDMAVAPAANITVCHWDWWRVQIWGFISIFTLNPQPFITGPLPEDNDLFWRNTIQGTKEEEEVISLSGIGAEFAGTRSNRPNADGGGARFAEPIEISSEHWLRWNQQIKLVSDVTIRLEDGFMMFSNQMADNDDGLAKNNNVKAQVFHGSKTMGEGGETSAPTQLCYWLLLQQPHHEFVSTHEAGNINCEAPNEPRRDDETHHTLHHHPKNFDGKFRDNSHGGGNRERLTWELLELNVGSRLAQDIHSLAIGFGYT
jgi:hypothetical protein